MSLQQNAVTVHVITTECRHGACHYNRMPSTAFIVAKLMLARQLSVKNTDTKFHEKPTNGSVADTRYLTEVRTDGSGLHAGRSSCYFVTNLQIWQQSLRKSERSLCHFVHELQHFIDCNRKKQLKA
jgi:hypothetical protein